jgi:hypothetical protein
MAYSALPTSDQVTGLGRNWSRYSWVLSRCLVGRIPVGWLQEDESSNTGITVDLYALPRSLVRVNKGQHID